jgi:large subunit ribosomal protein L29
MMKATQVRELTADEITARIAELERERFNLRFRGATQPLEDPLRLRVIRKDIARLKTVLREGRAKGDGTKAKPATAGTKS